MDNKAAMIRKYDGRGSRDSSDSWNDISFGYPRSSNIIRDAEMRETIFFSEITRTHKQAVWREMKSIVLHDDLPRWASRISWHRSTYLSIQRHRFGKRQA